MKSSLSFLSSRFFYVTRKSGQKFKYLENEKSFKDEIKCIFHDFKGLSLKQIKQIFLEGGRRTLRKNGSRKVPPGKFLSRKFPPIKIPTGTPPSPRKFPIRNIPTHFINCLSSLNTSFWQLLTNVKISKTKIWGLEELKMLFRNLEERI